MICPNAPGPCNCTGACTRPAVGQPPTGWAGGGLIATPRMEDLKALQDRCKDLETVTSDLIARVRGLEQWIKGYEAGKGATEVMTWPNTPWNVS